MRLTPRMDVVGVGLHLVVCDVTPRFSPNDLGSYK